MSDATRTSFAHARLSAEHVAQQTTTEISANASNVTAAGNQSQDGVVRAGNCRAETELAAREQRCIDLNILIVKQRNLAHPAAHHSRGV